MDSIAEATGVSERASQAQAMGLPLVKRHISGAPKNVGASYVRGPTTIWIPDPMS